MTSCIPAIRNSRQRGQSDSNSSQSHVGMAAKWRNYVHFSEAGRPNGCAPSQRAITGIKIDRSYSHCQRLCGDGALWLSYAAFIGSACSPLQLAPLTSRHWRSRRCAIPSARALYGHLRLGVAISRSTAAPSSFVGLIFTQAIVYC